MTIVPTFQREDLPQAQATGAQADIQAAGIPGEAVARLGAEGVSALSEIIQQENYDYAQTNNAGGRMNATNYFLKKQQAAQQSGNYDGFTADIRDTLNADFQQRIAGAPTPRAADALRRAFANQLDEFVTKAAVFEHAGHLQNYQANIDKSVADGSTIVYRDPSQADDVYAQLRGVIYGGAAAGLNQADLLVQDEALKHNIYGAEVQSGVDNNPQAMLGRLHSGEFDKLLTEQQLIHFQEQATEAVKRQQAEAQRQANENAIMVRGSVESAYQDNMASIRDTGKPAVPLSPAQIAAAYPHDPDRVQGMVASLQREQQGYVATQHIALTSPEQDVAALSAMKPQGAGYIDQAQSYNAMLKALQQKQADISASPAEYVQRVSPQVRALFQQASTDPSVLPKAVAAQDAAYDQLGLPPDNRPVLSPGQAASVVARFNGVDPSKTDVGAALDAMAKSYGAAWPRVFADLARARLPDQYQILASMDTKAQAAGRQDLQRALVVSAEKGGAQSLENLVPKDASTAIKSGLQDELATFRNTAVIPGAALNAELMTRVSNSISLLAHSYALQGQDGTTALKNAYDAVIGDKYDFDGTMRVPKGMLSQAHAATDQVLASMKPSELAAAAGLPPDIASDRWASAKRNSAWYPNESDDGLKLMIQNRSGQWIRALQTDGTPVQVMFKDLADAPDGAAVTAQAPADQSSGNANGVRVGGMQ